MIVLGIDTSTNTGGVALVNQEYLIGEYILNIKTNHSDRILPAIQLVLEDAGIGLKDLAGIAVVSGPGSFTGLRIGVATAKGFAYALNKPLIGLTALQAFAWQHRLYPGLVCPIMDARRQEVFTQVFKGNQAVTEPFNCGIDELLTWTKQQEQPVLFMGDGAILYKERLEPIQQVEFPAPEEMLLRPSSVASLGLQQLSQGVKHHPFELVPFYMRKSSAEY